MYNTNNMRVKRKSKIYKKGGSCGCGSGISILTSQKGGCVSCSSGGGFSNPATTHFPSSLPHNNYHQDPLMHTSSGRMEGVPISNTLNETGGNIINLRGGKKKRTKSKKAKSKSKARKGKGKKTRKQSGGIHLPQIAISSALGHNHYGSWFGAPTSQTPEWNESIFTTPSTTHNIGYSKYNSYMI